MIWTAIAPLLLKLVGAGADAVTAAQDRARAQVESKKQLDQARLEAEIEAQKAEAKRVYDYDSEAQRQKQRTIVDEILLFIMFAPVICSFIPGVQDYVLNGWSYLAEAPLWYQLLLIGMVASVFGLRWMVVKFPGFIWTSRTGKSTNTK